MMNRETLRDLSVFSLLLAFGVIGRWVQPSWNFTPLMAVTVMGGFYFQRWLPALLLPMGVLAVSDLSLPSHISSGVQVSVYCMMLVPLILGRFAQGAAGWRSAAWLAAGGVVPATAFFFVTNLAVWAFQSDYPSTWAGLTACYVRAIPFYRSMLAGDIFYLSLLLACWLAATAPAVRDHGLCEPSVVEETRKPGR